MPFVQRVIEPKYLSRTSLWDGQGKPKVDDGELEAVTNNTLSNALRQLASLVLVAEDIFADLGGQLQAITKRSDKLKVRIQVVDEKVSTYDPKKVTVPESDICTFALLKEHYVAKQIPDTNLFTAGTRPRALQNLYEAATKTPIHLMRQLDRWRRDGHRSSRFFMCTPVLGQKRRRIRNRVDIDIETRMPAAVKDLRRWTSSEALGDITVLPDCPNRILPNATVTDGETTDGTIASDDEGIDHKLPSPEEQLQVIALKFPAEIVAVDISGRSFDRMSVQRRSLLHGDTSAQVEDEVRRRSRTRRPRNRRRNTLAGTDQKEIRSALGAGEEPCSSANNETEPAAGAVSRSKSSDLLRSSSTSKSSSPKSHFNTLKQWGRNRYDWFKNKTTADARKEDVDDFNIYETVRRRRSSEKRSHERNPSISSSEKSSSVNLPVSPLSSVMNIAVKLRESSVQRRQRRKDGIKDEPHSSSGNWSASSESGRASVASETTTHPKSSATSSNSLNQAPNSINSRRRFINTSASSSITSEGTLTPDIIHDLHEDGDSVYSCDTEGYYTSFHMDSGLKTLKEEELPATPLHYTSAFSNSSSNNTVLTAENEYELFGKGSTSTTTSSAGTVCTTLRASDRSLAGCPAVPERKSSLNKYSPESSLERGSDKTGTVKRSPASIKANRESGKENGKQSEETGGNVSGDVSPDSGHNTSSSPIESICSPNGIRSGSEFEFSESSDMEGPERIERIRVKTTINSSRIPSMCVITPPQSDDESVKSYSNDYKNSKLRLDLKPNQDEVDVLKSSDSDKENMNIVQKRVIRTNGAVINVNTETGYATVETQKRAPSPSGGSVIVRDVPKKSPSQPIIKATLMPLFGKLKSNFVNLKRRESKSPNRIQDDQATVNSDEGISSEAGDYVTLADVRNNNEKQPKIRDLVYANVGRAPPVAVPKEKTEYVSLDELPCNGAQQSRADSLERNKRQGARVTLDAEGKVVYSSDSLKRKKGHTTFEPGPFVKDTPSPLPVHRVPKTVRPVNPASPHLGKLVIRANSGGTSNPEVVRIPPAIVSPNIRAMSPPRGAYVHIQDAGKLTSTSPTLDKARVPSPPNYPAYPESQSREMYNYRVLDENMDRRGYLESQYYLQKGGSMYQTLPSKKSQFIYADIRPERSVTPDITRGLERNYMDRNFAMPVPMPMVDRRYTYQEPNPLKLGIPVAVPDVSSFRIQHKVPSCYTPTKERPAYSSYISPHDNNQDDSIRISPIDPRNSGGFQSSTPSSSKPPADSKATVNLESILSPKKSTMSNEELYAVIHKSKKKMNIDTDDNRASPVGFDAAKRTGSPETGYIGDKSRSRLSWSPTKGEYIDFNSDIDKLSPPTDSRSRQSWACSDRKGTCQTSRMDFKKLLLQKSTVLSPVAKKLSAVEQLKLSKQQVQTQKPHQQSALNILELSGSPRSLTKKFNNPPAPGSPRNTAGEKPKPAPKLMSPRSQWRFTNPRSDVLSSTILEDCREDESPNSSIEKKKSPMKSGSVPQSQDVSDIVKGSVANRKSLFESKSTKECPSQPYSSISEKLQARRAQFFQSNPGTCPKSSSGDKSPPTLETAF